MSAQPASGTRPQADALLGTPNRAIDTRIPPERWRITLVCLAFWALAIAVQLNFNHLSNMAFGVGWGVTIAIAMCCVFLSVVARVPLRASLGTPGYLFVGALLSYVLIGFAVAMVVGFPPLAFSPSRPTRVVVGALVVVASAAGAAVLLKQVGVDSLLRGIALVLAAMCCLILVTPLLQDHVYKAEVFHWRYHPRWSGPFRDPNMASLAACNAVALGLTLLNSPSGRRLGISVVSLGLAAALVAYSRTATIVLVLLGAYFLFGRTGRSGRVSRRARFWLVAALATAGAMTFYANFEIQGSAHHRPPTERMTSLFTSETWKRPDKRFVLAVAALPRIADAWLTGSGLFSMAPMEGAPYCSSYKVCSVHNSFLQFWGESGLIPVALLVGGLFLLLRARLRFRQHHATDAVVGWLIVLIVGCLAIDDFPFLFWNAFLVGVSCALVSWLTLRQPTSPIATDIPRTA